MRDTGAELAAQARKAGYEVARVEQLRANRWLLTLRDDDGATALLMAQRRPLITAADVQDLAELVQCSRAARGVLLALDGEFSPEARRTVAELRRRPLQLCAALPPKGEGVMRAAPAVRG